MQELTLPAMPRARLTARLARCTSGLALTEFAFALPVLLALGLGGLETANYAVAHLKVSNIAMMTADNAARVRDSIDETQVVELLTGALRAGEDLEFGQNGRVILSSLQNDDGKQWIAWQRCIGALNIAPSYGAPLNSSGTAITNGTEFFQTNRTSESSSSQRSSSAAATLLGMGPAGNRISAAANTAVMVVEVTYQYQPIIPSSFLEGRRIRYESSFNVRQRNDQRLYNGNQITPRSCNTFSAT